MTKPTGDDFRAAKVLPVIEIDDADRAEGLADALAAGGLKVLELTLRSDAAIPSLERIKKARPDLIVGMGTVIDMAGARAALDAGADFLVTPGATPRLLDGLAEAGPAVLPGVATLGEAMACLERGFSFLKFFPAEPLGGVRVLRAWAGPLPQARFCPTGGIAADRVGEYRALANVVCVGGSWVAPRAAIAAGRWDDIKANAQTAARIGEPPTA